MISGRRYDVGTSEGRVDWADMIYLEVLPVFVVILAAMGGVTLLARMAPAGRPYFPYAWRALVASTVGILSANVALWGIVVTVGSVLTVMDPSNQFHVALPSALEALLHPHPASLAGGILGCAFGISWAYFANRRAGDQSPSAKLAT